jgi:hypothetical protein
MTHRLGGTHNIDFPFLPRLFSHRHICIGRVSLIFNVYTVIKVLYCSLGAASWDTGRLRTYLMEQSALDMHSFLDRNFLDKVGKGQI